MPIRTMKNESITPACRTLCKALVSVCKVQYAPTESRLQGKLMSNFRFVPGADVASPCTNQRDVSQLVGYGSELSKVVAPTSAIGDF